jgi:predicted ATP-grasp superfamily ATP-dependent carboligase
MSGAQPHLLVIAISGRALAQSARRGGFQVRVLDAFADSDAQQAGEAQSIAADHAIAIDPQRLFDALGAPQTRFIVLGAGFERSPELIDRLAQFGALCGNETDVVRALKEPLLCAQLLSALELDVPHTQLEPPLDARGWLQKEIGGAGGVHVRSAAGAPHSANRYYQRIVDGQPMSVTFLADAQRAYILGFNQQTIARVGKLPYCYVGAATCSVVPALEGEMQYRLDRLVRVTGLRGLNGIDFMLKGEQVQVLEVNPRPTATFELYEPDFAHGLVHWHVASFQDSVPQFASLIRAPHRLARAYRIVFAKYQLRVPLDVQYAAWCRDRPQPGSEIHSGAPVFSVFAEGGSPAVALEILMQRVSEVDAMLETWSMRAEALSAREQGVLPS